MREASYVAPGFVSDRRRPAPALENQLFLLRQPSGPGYRARARVQAGRSHRDWYDVGARLERDREYQRLLARLVGLSSKFQRSLTPAQHKAWLALEDALLDHAWFLHAHYFSAGYELGKAVPKRPRHSARQRQRSQVALLAALARLVADRVQRR